MCEGEDKKTGTPHYFKVVFENLAEIEKELSKA